MNPKNQKTELVKYVLVTITGILVVISGILFSSINNAMIKELMNTTILLGFVLTFVGIVKIKLIFISSL